MFEKRIDEQGRVTAGEGAKAIIVVENVRPGESIHEPIPKRSYSAGPAINRYRKPIPGSVTSLSSRGSNNSSSFLRTRPVGKKKFVGVMRNTRSNSLTGSRTSMGSSASGSSSSSAVNKPSNSKTMERLSMDEREMYGGFGPKKLLNSGSDRLVGLVSRHDRGMERTTPQPLKHIYKVDEAKKIEERILLREAEAARQRARAAVRLPPVLKQPTIVIGSTAVQKRMSSMQSARREMKTESNEKMESDEAKTFNEKRGL